MVVSSQRAVGGVVAKFLCHPHHFLDGWYISQFKPPAGSDTCSKGDGTRGSFLPVHHGPHWADEHCTEPLGGHCLGCHNRLPSRNTCRLGHARSKRFRTKRQQQLWISNLLSSQNRAPFTTISSHLTIRGGQIDGPKEGDLHSLFLLFSPTRSPDGPLPFKCVATLPPHHLSNHLCKG